MLQVFLDEDPEIEYLFCGAPSGSETTYVSLFNELMTSDTRILVLHSCLLCCNGVTRIVRPFLKYIFVCCIPINFKMG